MTTSHAGSAGVPDPTGHVIPGGDSWVLELPGAQVRKFSVSEMDNNVYLLTCTVTGERLLVDAADDADRIRAELVAVSGTSGSGGRGSDGDGSRSSGIGSRGSVAPVAQVLTTHRHWDHHRALPDIVESTGAATLAGAADADELPVDVGTRLEHGDTVRVGDLVLDVVGLRGHTPGSVALALATGGDVCRTVMFTGDSLFPGGPGKTWSPDDFVSLMDDLEERVFGVYPDDTVVLPGHGDNTTLGAERPHLQEWRERGW